MKIKELQARVRELLKRRQAILLAHNYQRAEIQEIADLTGDSLGLSIQAAETDADVIVFCGVHFMAETASIICPDKTVLLPRLDAGCPMADMITAPALRIRKAELPGVPVVTYVNTTATVKAVSDICCTSANAIAVINSLPGDRVLMTPDRNLGQYAQRHVKKEILLWNGCCNIHDRLGADQILRAKARWPEALVVAHPECRPEVLDLADAVRSTSGMISFCGENHGQKFIVATENGLLYQLRRQNPDKQFYQASRAMLCPDMKLTRLEDIVEALATMNPVIKVPEEIRRRALKAVNRMLAVPRD
ncbi:MAG: quinolinate synthase NadA [Deltaproteobacteria bacterium]|nr:quinolinate synthase NadA [Deltaproteobacteria bacterium]MBW2085196.1 quinolinate synthase NadA [Deltaproteobacteria bacterium]